ISVQDLDDGARILFLQRFGAELVMNSARDEILKNKIKAEKIKLKYLEAKKEVSVADFGMLGIFHEQQEKEREVLPRVARSKIVAKPLYKSSFISKAPPKKISPVVIVEDKNTTAIKDFTTIVEGVEEMGIGAYTQVERFLKDPGVQLIECSGPGKNILLKVKNNIRMTRLVLNEQGIQEVITTFANRANVPVVGGVVKVAVDDLLVSAVVSKFVGSRFIISRQSPYSLIDAHRTI